MPKLLARTRREGGSLVVTLPQQLVSREGIREREIVEVTVKKLRKDGFGLLKGIGSFTVNDELKAHE